MVLVALGVSLSIAIRANGNTERIPRDAIVWIDGKGQGSGVIIHRQGNNYAVLTNWHVVKTDGNYTIKTNSSSIPYSSKKRLGNVDLALLFFTSRDRYNYARLGDSNNLNEGQPVYVPTYILPYPSSRRETREQSYTVYAGNLVRIQPPDENGYALVLDDINERTTSGSPTFDENGRVIGIYGHSEKHPDVTEVELYAIPSNTARQLASRVGVSLTQPVATSPQRQPALPQPQPRPNRPSSSNIIEPEIPRGSLLDGQTGMPIEEPSLPSRPLLD